MLTIKETALKLRDEGFSVIPVHPTEKRPTISAWTEYQKRQPTPEEMETWDWRGVGVICGEVSENLVCIDIDTKNDLSGSLIRDFIGAVKAIDPKLLDRLVVEETMNHGRHILFRAPHTIPTKDLALEANRAVIIETRGEGAYFVCAPTPGYRLTQGEIYAAPILTEEETQIILSAAESINRYAPETVTYQKTEMKGSGVTPLDDYDAKTGIEAMADMLVSRGWKTILRRGETFSLCRPDKHERAISATLGHIPGRLYIFSTSTEFEARRAYKASQMYCVLNHGGDYHAAAKDLYAQGFGERKEHKNEPAPVKVQHDTQEKITVVGVNDLRDKVKVIWERGMDKGLTTGFSNLEGLYRAVKGQLNIMTGIPSHGKSEFLDNLLYNFAKIHDWKCLIFSPENYPLELHVRKLAEKAMQRSFYTPEKGKAPFKDVEAAMTWMASHFWFVNVGEADIDLEGILALAGQADYDLVLIDPWNEIGDSTPKGTTEHAHIGTALRRVRKFARQKKISFWIAAHPNKMRKDSKTGETPIPNMYDISDSSHWYNKADNGFCVNRDFAEGSTELHVLKVKFKYYGKTGVAKFRYIEDGGVFVPWSVSDDFGNPPPSYRDRQTGDTF